jgi:hypothetical protein
MGCKCQDWQKIVSTQNTLFKEIPNAGWHILKVELVNEGNHHQIYTYGIAIQYCPFCGAELLNSKK